MSMLAFLVGYFENMHKPGSPEQNKKTMVVFLGGVFRAPELIGGDEKVPESFLSSLALVVDSSDF